MNTAQINKALIVSASCLILLAGFLLVYFRQAVFTGDFYIQMPASDIVAEAINVEARTPSGRIQTFNRMGNERFNLSGFYTHFNIYIPDAARFEDTDTLTVTANETVFHFSMVSLRQTWPASRKGAGLVYEVPPDLFPKTLLPARLNTLFVYTGFTPAALLLYVLIVLGAAVAALFYLRFREPLQRMLMLWKGRMQMLLPVFAGLVYFIIFLKSASFTAFVPLSGDSWEYQVMGVNLAKGHGVQRLSLLEPFDTYAFDTQQTDPESLHNLNALAYYVRDTYRTPAYPAFVGLVYALAGVDPYILKALQLLLLCIVAACLPFLCRAWWGRGGYFAGLVSGFVFITMYYPVAGTVMTESLLIFVSFMLVWCLTALLQKPSAPLYLLAGFLAALSLLVKGMLVFFILILFLTALWFYLKRRSMLSRKGLRTAMLAFVLTLLPWSVFASRVNRFMLIEPISKNQIRAATDSVGQLLAHTTIDSSNIILITDSVSGIYFRNKYWEAPRYHFVKDFTARYPGIIVRTFPQVINFIKKEMNIFYLKHLDYLSVPYFGGRYLYINYKGLTLLSTQPATLLLESHNEHSTDGGWHQEARHETYYYKTDNRAKPAFLRVLGFYWNNPTLFIKIAAAKMGTGFGHFIFVQMLLVFMILHIWWPGRRHLWQTGVFLALAAMLVLLVKMFTPALPVLMGVTLLSVLYAWYRRRPLMPFCVPAIVWHMLLNTLLITLVFYGLDRFTMITEFLVIPLVFCFVAHLFILPQNHKNTEVQQNLSR